VVASSEYQDLDGNPILEEIEAGELLADSILEQAAKREGVGTDGHPKRLTREEAVKVSALYSGKLPEPRLTVGDAHELYKEKRFGGLENKATDTAFKQFVEFAGNVPLASVSRRTVHDWMDWLMTTRGQAAETIKRRVGAMKAIFNFVADRELFDGKNPFERMSPPSTAKKPVDRLPFHRFHLEAIDTYLKMSNRVLPETRHLIALLKFTGCRPSEIGGLTVEDLSLEGPIPYAMVRWTAERRLKNFQSQRRVPLIGEALQAAQALADTRRSGWLFPSLAPNNNKKNDNPALSSRLNNVIRRAGVPNSPSLVAYSFRHTMVEALDQVPTLSFKVRERAVGRGNTDQYGAKEQPLEVSLQAMNAAIPLLGRVDDVMYEPWMLEIKPRNSN
jgi:integrase